MSWVIRLDPTFYAQCANNSLLYRYTFESALHGTGVYSAGVGPKGPALERFINIKKKTLLYRYEWLTS
jgi:hypothetical protein